MVFYDTGGDVDNPDSGVGSAHQGQQVPPLCLQCGGQSGLCLLKGINKPVTSSTSVSAMWGTVWPMSTQRY